MSEAEFIIWDDPFSSVDLILEKEIISKLRENVLVNGKTFILTSHRLTTVRSSDFVYFIDKEEAIVEKGETQQLLNGKSIIYEYFQKQMV